MFWRRFLTQYAYCTKHALLILFITALNINLQPPTLEYRRNVHPTQRYRSS